jgi:hypothetical protein
LYSSNHLSGSYSFQYAIPPYSTTDPFPLLAVCLDLYSLNRPDSRVHACSSSYSLNRSSSRPLNPQIPFHVSRFPNPKYLAAYLGLHSLNRPGSRANHSSSYSSNRLSGSVHSNTLPPYFTTDPFPSLAVCLDLYSSNRPDSRVHACSSPHSLNRSSNRPLNSQFQFHESRFPSKPQVSGRLPWLVFVESPR